MLFTVNKGIRDDCSTADIFIVFTFLHSPSTFTHIFHFYPLSSIFIHIHPYPSICINFLQFASICIHLQPFVSIFNHQRPPSSTFIHLRPPASTCILLCPLASNCIHLCPPASTCAQTYKTFTHPEFKSFNVKVKLNLSVALETSPKIMNSSLRWRQSTRAVGILEVT